MDFKVQKNEPIGPNVFRMELLGDTRSITRPGQFVQVSVPGFYLRRPLSVCDWMAGEQGALTLIYKQVGRGTEAMSRMATGTTVDILPGLGNGYDVEAAKATGGKGPLVVGGGVGTPPLYGLCKHLLVVGLRPEAVLGFNTVGEVFLQKELEALGVPVTLCTADGSCGVKGFVTQGMEGLGGKYSYVFACGPQAMLKAVHEVCQDQGIPGQYSLEERMACGFGVCMGCSCKTKEGSKRICKDGPVLGGEEITW